MNDYTKYPPATRPVAMGSNGMVTSGSLLASQAGLDVLKDDCNAFDAIVATATTLGVTEPYMSGPGGTGIALAYVAGEGRIRVLDFTGRAPAAAKSETFTELTKQDGPLSVIVPGNVAGWLVLHREYGKLDWERVIRPAIRYAAEGFPFTYQNSEVTDFYADRLRPYPSAVATLLRGDHAPRPGSRVRMPDLAGSLSKIAKQGLEVFYRGELAQRIVSAVQSMGGILNLDDLADYKAVWQDPIHISYRGREIHVPPPGGTGFQTLETLKIIEGLGDGIPSFHDAHSLHMQMEASKLAIADRIEFGGDPDHVDIPLDGLLSDRYAASQRSRIDPDSASYIASENFVRDVPDEAVRPGRPRDFKGGMTTHLAAADRDGNVVSITQSLGHFFGSGVVAGDTGIFMNDMAMMFDLDEDSPNVIGPGKRAANPMHPTHTTKNGKFLLSMGTPGGFGIPQTTAQLLINVLDFGMNVQQAVEAPEFRHYSGREVRMEERFPWHVRQELARRGHEVTVLEPFSMRVGGAHAIRVNQESGVFEGAADPRRDGFALAW